MDEVVSALIDLALVEDVGLGDVTSEYFVPADRMARAMVLGKTDGILAGTEIAKEVFQRVDEETGVNILLDDGSHIAPGAIVMEVRGAARSLLTAERTALNFLQRLSGVATKTAEFVEAVRGTGAVILDTRKTTPGWRFLQKAAVVSGGGQNHRMGLYDRAMVKDNHLVAEGGLEALQAGIKELKEENPGVQVELEVDRLEQMEAFLTLEGVDYILLDNMDNETLAKAVAMRSENGPLLEASGGVNLETVRGIAETGVKYISVGALTHSAIALDLSLEFVNVD
ncbi:MAG: carboxylating nicotinate-nucleotide diphosphorylase [Akkermansiaceae bacterium]|nr:carboxylating nicotinate-nucleotide diphosphorylase [Akkermansiaceae bacterium]